MVDILPSVIDVAVQSDNTQSSAKCLGVWCQHDLSPCKSVEENIAEARRAFFALGCLDPMTDRSVFQILSSLLYYVDVKHGFSHQPLSQN